MKEKGYGKFPLWIIFLSDLILFSVGFVGTYLSYLVNPIVGLLYLFWWIYLEYSTFTEGCVNCHYYGKRCAFGRGIIAKHLFAKGNPKKFCERKVTQKDMIPYYISVAIPLFSGIYLLWLNFDWSILVMMVYPMLVMFLANPVIYGKWACPNCKQGAICCPAMDFFAEMQTKGKKKNNKKQK